jgi:hypothetical protein
MLKLLFLFFSLNCLAQVLPPEPINFEYISIKDCDKRIKRQKNGLPFSSFTDLCQISKYSEVPSFEKLLKMRTGAQDYLNRYLEASKKGVDMGGGADSAVPVDAEYIAWFSSPTIKFCLKRNPDYFMSTEEAIEQIQLANKMWNVYVAYKKIPVSVPRLAFEPNCGPSVDLTFYLDTVNPDISKYVTLHPKAFGGSALDSFDIQKLHGKGWIWLADFSKYLTVSNSEKYGFLMIALHEIGHTLCNAHINGTIMDEHISEYIQGYKSVNENGIDRLILDRPLTQTTENLYWIDLFFAAHIIDMQNELYICNDCMLTLPLNKAVFSPYSSEQKSLVVKEDPEIGILNFPQHTDRVLIFDGTNYTLNLKLNKQQDELKKEYWKGDPLRAEYKFKIEHLKSKIVETRCDTFRRLVPALEARTDGKTELVYRKTGPCFDRLLQTGYITGTQYNNPSKAVKIPVTILRGGRQEKLSNLVDFSYSDLNGEYKFRSESGIYNPKW